MFVYRVFFLLNVNSELLIGDSWFLIFFRVYEIFLLRSFIIIIITSTAQQSYYYYYYISHFKPIKKQNTNKNISGDRWWWSKKNNWKIGRHSPKIFFLFYINAQTHKPRLVIIALEKPPSFTRKILWMFHPLYTFNYVCFVTISKGSSFFLDVSSLYSQVFFPAFFSKLNSMTHYY